MGEHCRVGFLYVLVWEADEFFHESGGVVDAVAEEYEPTGPLTPPP